MKSIQNFILRTNVYFAKEQSRQIELVQKKIQQQAHGGLQQHPQSNAFRMFFINQRQRISMTRPFQRMLSSSAFSHHIRMTYFYSMLTSHQEHEDILHRQQTMSLQNDSQIDLMASQDAIQSSSENYEGILDVLNNPPSGTKEFCGKYIELNFQHVLETFFNYSNQDDDARSLVSSQYIDDECNTPRHGDNVTRIQNGQGLLSLSVQNSEMYISEDEDDNNYSSYFYQTRALPSLQ